MPIDHDILNDGELVISKATGIINGDDLADHMFWLINQFGSALNEGYHQIFDTLSADTADITADDMKRISQIILTYGQGRGQIATALVAEEPAIRKLAFHYKSLSGITDINVEVFSNRTDAETWLNTLK